MRYAIYIYSNGEDNTNTVQKDVNNLNLENDTGVNCSCVYVNQ